jgi:hypothetical protein
LKPERLGSLLVQEEPEIKILWKNNNNNNNRTKTQTRNMTESNYEVKNRGKLTCFLKCNSSWHENWLWVRRYRALLLRWVQTNNWPFCRNKAARVIYRFCRIKHLQHHSIKEDNKVSGKLHNEELNDLQIEKNEMGGACSACEGEERCILGFGGETWR